MSEQLQYPIGTQVWARMPSTVNANQPAAQNDTEVLAWVVGYERRGSSVYYRCKAPETEGIWTFSSDEVVSGVSLVRHPFSFGARFGLGQTVRVKKRVEWRRSGGGDVQKSGRVAAGWCKRVQDGDGDFLDYTYWIDFSESDQAHPRNWYPQEDLEG